MHMACRRGFLDVVNVLVAEAGVTICRCDNMGRTPLHDAFWTVTPNFELVHTLIALDRRLMLVCDKRGHTPLGYARNEHWDACCKFLDEFWASATGEVVG